MNVYLHPVAMPKGSSWSAPVRINDDTVNAWQNWQWMAAAAVSPNGRIDAIWLDTRNGGRQHEPGSALLRLLLGRRRHLVAQRGRHSNLRQRRWAIPNQFKMGDYYHHRLRTRRAADVAYAATFNGEQDVYHVRVFPDCNGNGVSDVTDIAAPAVFDCNANHVPDGCESAPVCLGAGAVSGGLVLGKASGGDLALQWSASCTVEDDDYAVYEGALLSFASHIPRACTTAGETSHLLAPAGGDTYYLLVPTHADREGSYGVDAAGAGAPGRGCRLPSPASPPLHALTES